MSSKVKFDFKSIKFRLWLYFLIIVIVVLAILWVLQVFFLNNYYEDMKIKEVSNVGNSVVQAFRNKDENVTQEITNYSIVNDYYFMMESGNGTILLFSPEQESTKPVYLYQNMIPKLKEKIVQNYGSDHVSIKFDTGKEDYSTLAYASIIDNTPGEEVYLYIFSPLYPVSSTVEILKNQLFIVTIVSVIMAFILALIFSIRIARPLQAMTISARKLGSGDYSVRFDVHSYSELNKLGDTLNTAAYEMEQADNRQKDLVANVSHDMKTPLTMIRSYAEMIRDLSGDNPQKRNAHLQVILDEADRMSNLVSDMSTVSAMATHKINLEYEFFDLSEVTAAILSSYEIYVEQQGYDFRFTPVRDCMVYADRDRIIQVITNLTSNAIKYCGEDKVIIVDIHKTGKKYCLEVSDHGPGIKQDEIPHVWDRYYKTSSNYVRTTTGTGLGLSIVKEILTLHHAPFGVISKEGQGTTFWFELDMVKK